jgi:hypothetical protein
MEMNGVFGMFARWTEMTTVKAFRGIVGLERKLNDQRNAIEGKLVRGSHKGERC